MTGIVYGIFRIDTGKYAMGICKCKAGTRIVSNMVQSINQGGNCNCNTGLVNICANPVCGEPDLLSLYAPLIYDEIGINLCTTFDLGVEIQTTYPTVTNADIKVLDATYEYGTDAVSVEQLAGQPNCYVVTLTDITVQFIMNLYDDTGRPVDTIYPTAVYLPSDTTAPTYDEDTNPASVELEVFAPYGLSYDTTAAAPTPVINEISFSAENNMPRQGLNLYQMAKILDFNTDDSTATVGLTMILQSLYYAGYQVTSQGRIEVPKGNIVTPDNTACMCFVEGDLLELEIKPLDLSVPPGNGQCGCNQCGGGGNCGCANTGNSGCANSSNTASRGNTGGCTNNSAGCGNTGGCTNNNTGCGCTGSANNNCTNSATDRTVVLNGIPVAQQMQDDEP